MDVPVTNQSLETGRTPPSPPGLHCNPVPSFQHLSLGWSDPRLSHDHLQGFSQGYQGDLASARHIYRNGADQSGQQIIYDARVSAVTPAASQGRNIAQCEGIQGNHNLQLPLCSPHKSHQAISPPLEHTYTQQDLLNGLQSPSQHQMPLGLPSLGLFGKEGSLPSAQSVLERTNVESPVSAEYIYNNAALPTSPIQQQPQWAFSQHPAGRFI